MALPTTTLLRRGFSRRCPVCGHGHLFRQWVRMAPSCPTCGLVFARLPGQWLGSWFLNVCVAQTAVVLILIVGVGLTWPDPPMVVLSVAAGLAAVGVPFAFFPWSRTIWTAIDLAMRPLGFDEGVAPGFELDEPSPPTARPGRRPRGAGRERRVRGQGRARRDRRGGPDPGHGRAA